MTMGLRRWWAGMVARRAERAALRRARRGRVRVTWRTCRRCGSYGYQTGKSGLCAGCRSLQ
jgi:hypothetical protein